MKRRYIWTCVLGIVGAYINSKGESLFSQPVLLGFVGGAAIGFVVGLLLEKMQKKKRKGLQGRRRCFPP
jgi:ABC-type cobalamin transport system permease subunit